MNLQRRITMVRRAIFVSTDQNDNEVYKTINEFVKCHNLAIEIHHARLLLEENGYPYFEGMY